MWFIIIGIIGILIGIIGVWYGVATADRVEMSNEVLRSERELLEKDISTKKEMQAQLISDTELLIQKQENEQCKLKATQDAVAEIAVRQYGLNNDLINLKTRIADAEDRKKFIEHEIESAQKRLGNINTLVSESMQNQQVPLQQAAEQYLAALEQSYDNAEQQYDLALTILDQAYDMKQDAILQDIEQLEKEQQALIERAAANYQQQEAAALSRIEAAAAHKHKDLEQEYQTQQLEYQMALEELKIELDKLRATRAAAIEAFRKEQEIREQQSFYCLTIPNPDLADIQRLNQIKPSLNNPRILSMLIWSTFFQKPMTALCNNILGTVTVCGIYKITNLTNNMCYIGQAVNVADRWKQHAKCGLGIDTPVGNKLYKAMIAEGIQNFTWELLEACPRDQLNEKEKYYIELYDSVNYGYNIVHGVVKGN